MYWLIKWQHKPTEDATREDAISANNKFPNFRLEEKPILQGGGIDKDNTLVPPLAQPTTDECNKPKIWRVYRRRHKIMLDDGNPTTGA